MAQTNHVGKIRLESAVKIPETHGAPRAERVFGNT